MANVWNGPALKKSGGGEVKGVDKFFKPLPQSGQKPFYLKSNDRREKIT